MPSHHCADVFADIVGPADRCSSALPSTPALLHIAADNKAAKECWNGINTFPRCSHPELPGSSGLPQGTTPLSNLRAEPTAWTQSVEWSVSLCKRNEHFLALPAAQAPYPWFGRFCSSCQSFVFLRNDVELWVWSIWRAEQLICLWFEVFKVN